METETPIKNLYRRIKMTYFCRFSADRRLKKHEALSLWTISIFSIGLIVLPIARALGIQNNASQITTMLEVASAIVILVYSIIVNKSDFSHRSYQFHNCGLELNDLDRKLYKFIDREVSDEDIDSFTSTYNEILRRYENHSNLDFFSAKVNSFPDYYKLNFCHRLLLWLWYSLEYSQYFILLLLQIGLFYYIFKK